MGKGGKMGYVETNGVNKKMGLGGKWEKVEKM